MEEALRYIVIVFIIWAVCRKIYKSVSSRTVDYVLWAFNLVQKHRMINQEGGKR